MSDHQALHAAARDVARGVLAERRSALEQAGLRAAVDVERHFEDGRERWSEIRIDFWRGTAFVDVLETFLVRDGAAVATSDELKSWLEENVDDVLREQDGG